MSGEDGVLKQRREQRTGWSAGPWSSGHLAASSPAPPCGELLESDYPAEPRRRPIGVTDRCGAGDGGADLQ